MKAPAAKWGFIMTGQGHTYSGGGDLTEEIHDTQDRATCFRGIDVEKDDLEVWAGDIGQNTRQEGNG